MHSMPSSPLDGLRILEVGGIGPAPFAGMLLAELGADVVRIDRPGASPAVPIDPADDVLNRGKRSVTLDLKHSYELELLLALAERADVLVEGYRPGVAERLGFGPARCHERNPRLVFARMTGWGQDGPRAELAGHDINYIGVTGALDAIGEAGRPPAIPLNLVGDFGGGGMYLAVGILAAVRDVERTGNGRVIDAAIVDGTAHLLAYVLGMRRAGLWNDGRGANLLDGGVPFYTTYETSDAGRMAVGAIEPKFYANLLAVLELDLNPADQYDETTWPATRARLAQAFLDRTRADWTARFATVDACVTPVLTFAEAVQDPHLRHRGTLVGDHESALPARAPRFSDGLDGPVASPPPKLGADREDVVADWDVTMPAHAR
jgi:alpha-methylacyl-CoA racemase